MSFNTDTWISGDGSVKSRNRYGREATWSDAEARVLSETAWRFARHQQLGALLYPPGTLRAAPLTEHTARALLLALSTASDDILGSTGSLTDAIRDFSAP